ncbi:2-dehydro-3-deoxygalactonokinase [Aestuariibius sp. 2305UL40-4]|uniref:2-dehydro-3-deoxygalactonokinase n=1 Tax=Aestuariibius violaceus TaxID=3234132 RepID=UPI00345EF062
MSVAPDWIAVDWGTSNVRAWAMSASGTVLAEAHSADGMGTLARDQFEGAFRRLTDGWVAAPAIACGMVGARQGWAEAPYRQIPCVPLGEEAARPESDLDVRIIPGLKQRTPPDVMRGEETQIAGFQALNPNWDGVICLPGTHTKWVQVSAGEVVSFQTFLTGDLFAALTEHTVLKHSTAGEMSDEESFRAAVHDALAKPERLAARLFGIRADHLLNDIPQDSLRARLSGLLIGAELAAARPYWLGQQIAVIGAPGLAKLYMMALAAQGVPAIEANAERMTLAGLKRARECMKLPT